VSWSYSDITRHPPGLPAQASDAAAFPCRRNSDVHCVPWRIDWNPAAGSKRAIVDRSHRHTDLVVQATAPSKNFVKIEVPAASSHSLDLAIGVVR